MNTTTIEEGLVKIYKEQVVGKVNGSSPGKKRGLPSEEEECTKKDAPKNTLFYNPAQVFNRDFSLIVLKVFGQRRIQSGFDRFREAQCKRHIGEEVKGLTICEPLGATGLRSLRYIKELPKSFCRKVWCGDIDPFAVEAAKRNRELNEIDPAKLECLQADALELLSSGKYICGTSQWDVVDIDPYGTATPFVDGAVRAVKSGGLLCVTSTDMPVLGGNAPEVAFYKYGGNTVKARYLHEMALRLVFHSLQMAAGRYRRYVQPLVSLSADFYVRLFVTVWDKPQKCSDTAPRTAIVHQCSACDWFVTIPFGRYVDQSERQLAKKRKLEHKHGRNRNAEAMEQSNNEDDCQETAKILNLPRVWTYKEDVGGSKHALGRLPDEVNGARCPQCSSSIVLGGPFYAGPLHDPSFLTALLNEIDRSECAENSLLMSEAPEANDTDLFSASNDTLIESAFTGDRVVPSICAPEELAAKLDWVELAYARFKYDQSHSRLTGLNKAVAPKIRGVLRAMQEELFDVPLYYKLSSLCNDAHVSMIKVDRFKSALLHMGYRVGLFHREPLSIKTDAPAFVLFDIIKAWIKKQKDESEGHGSQFARVPERYLRDLDPRTPEIDLSHYHPSLSSANDNKVPRWVPNPSSHWGPGRKAGHKSG